MTVRTLAALALFPVASLFVGCSAVAYDGGPGYAYDGYYGSSYGYYERVPRYYRGGYNRPYAYRDGRFDGGRSAPPRAVFGGNDHHVAPRVQSHPEPIHSEAGLHGEHGPTAIER